MTVRFQTRANNGAILIPREFLSELNGVIDVSVTPLSATLLADEPYDIITELTRNPIKLPDYRPLTRDEIYDRKK